MIRHGRLGMLLALLFASLWPAVAAADELLCAPVAKGVPELEPKHPKWWDGGPAWMPKWPESEQDPRWRGASQHAEQDGIRLRLVRGKAHAQALSDVGPYLFVSIDNVDFGVGSNIKKYLWLGLADDDAGAETDDCTKQVLHRINLGDVSLPISSYFYHPPSQLYSAVVNNCSFQLDQVKVLAGGDRARLLVRLPASVGKRMRFFVATTNGDSGVVLKGSWPEALTTPEKFGVNAATAPPRASWGVLEMWRDICPGVSIRKHDIGVAATFNGASLDLDKAVAGVLINEGNTVNWLVARARVPPSSSSAAAEMSARFRISAWGSPSPSDWVVPPGASSDCQGSKAVQSVGEVRLFRCSWSPASLAGWQQEQALLVELFGGDNLNYYNDSAFRGMLFKEAFVANASAIISNVGKLEFKPTGNMMLMVRAINMPAPQPQPFNPLTRMAAAVDARISRLGKLPGLEQKQGKQLPREVFKEREMLGDVKTAIVQSRSVEELFGKLRHTPQSVLDRVMPNLVVDVFYEAIETSPVNGNQRLVYRRRPSFGMNVMHMGDIAGWRYQLRDAGGRLLKPLPGRRHTYKLKLPANGRTKLGVAVLPQQHARDRGDGPTGGGTAGTTGPGGEPKPVPTPAGGCGHCAVGTPPRQRGLFAVCLAALALLLGFASRRAARR